MNLRPGRLSALLLAGTSSLCALATAEATVRIFWHPHHGYGRIVAARGKIRLDCYPTNPRAYFPVDLRRPEMRALYHDLAPMRYDSLSGRAPWAVESRFNSLGFREVEPLPPSSAVRRVVLLGDSFTEGQGVREDDVTARVMQRALDARSPGVFEVRNCGRRASNFPELHDVWRSALRYAPNVLIYNMVLNDVERSPEFDAGHPFVQDWIMVHAQDERDGPDAPRWHPRLASFARHRVDTWRVARETTRWYRDMYGEANRPGWAATQAYIREMNRTQRERGGTFVLALWPLLTDLGRYPFAEVHQEIERFCLQAGIRFVDLRPALAARSAQDLWVHEVDHHPNELADRLAAEALAPVVLEVERPRR